MTPAALEQLLEPYVMEQALDEVIEDVEQRFSEVELMFQKILYKIEQVKEESGGDQRQERLKMQEKFEELENQVKIHVTELEQF